MTRKAATPSPLAGLARYAEMYPGKVKVRRVPAERRERMRLVRLIEALASIAGLRITTDEETETQEVDLGDREPASWHGFKADGDVYLHRCKYSGHNGDPYDHCWKKLSALEATVALQGIASELERRALAAEERRLEEAARRRLTEVAKRNLTARLRGKGVLPES